MKSYNVIGMMSGTSLDGVDIAYVKLTEDEGHWAYELIEAKTVEYTDMMKDMLGTVERKRANGFAVLHSDYGRFLAKLLKYFIESNYLKPDLIASHGHTVFHQPQNRLTVQIGSGAAIAALTGIPVVCNFRTVDVALGGQGAPLVPIGDRYLFGEYDYCLNLGGIANVSYENDLQPSLRIAGDIVPCNLILNPIAQHLGLPFDNEGAIARGGVVNEELLTKLNHLKYYSRAFPKSMGKEFINEQHILELSASKISNEDKLRTACEHIAYQIGRIINAETKDGGKRKRMLVTGGGAFNTFLMERIQEECAVEVIVPDHNVVKFKEAIIFGLLGVLRYRGEVNCLKSVTGASRDSVGGAIYF